MSTKRQRLEEVVFISLKINFLQLSYFKFVFRFIAFALKIEEGKKAAGVFTSFLGIFFV